jgi:hypothetical protein
VLLVILCQTARRCIGLLRNQEWMHTTKCWPLGNLNLSSELKSVIPIFVCRLVAVECAVRQSDTWYLLAKTAAGEIPPNNDGEWWHHTDCWRHQKSKQLHLLINTIVNKGGGINPIECSVRVVTLKRHISTEDRVVWDVTHDSRWSSAVCSWARE